MKVIMIFAAIMLISCSSQKQDFKIIESYIQKEIRNVGYDSIFFNTDAVPVGELISTYERMYKYKEHITIEPDSFDEWPFDENEIAQIKNKLPKTPDKWEGARNEKMIFVSKDSLDNVYFRRKHMSEHNIIIYSSKLLYNDKINKAVFYISGGNMLTRNNIFRGIIIYEKKNGEWEMAAKLQEEIYD